MRHHDLTDTLADALTLLVAVIGGLGMTYVAVVLILTLARAVWQ